jgi:hypothetical protein
MTAKNDNDPVPPRRWDRMPGRYWRRMGWWGRQEHASRWRRRVDDRTLRRYADTVVQDDAANDPSDCRHGCNGDCVASGVSDRCNFTCHPHLRACPRCGGVIERYEVHDHANRACHRVWSCRKCMFMETAVLVGCRGE